jgi:hypothetical protein
VPASINDADAGHCRKAAQYARFRRAREHDPDKFHPSVLPDPNHPAGGKQMSRRFRYGMVLPLPGPGSASWH